MKSSLEFNCIAKKTARIVTGSLLAVLPALIGMRADSAELVCGSGYYVYQGACVIVPAPVYGVRPSYGAPGYGTRGYGAPGVPAAGAPGYGAPGVPAAGAPGYGAAGQGANVNGGVNRPARR